jgi:hypothetical protein
MKTITETRNNNRKVKIEERQLGSQIWFEVYCCEMTLGGWWKVVKQKTYTKKSTAEKLSKSFLAN